ncbi:MAG TPA: lipopolysaccharide heptosyltransferase II [Thermoanaerobaculia bacterium]|nr:lipopolysaccharide heptosyltransferase II [Thermoanaerobaculia bacterium]
MGKGRVVVAPNWLGDCVMALPLLRAIRTAHPEDLLAVLARPGAASIFRAEGSAGSVLERGSLLDDARSLRRGRFAEAWLLPNSFRSAVAPFLARVPERIGYATDRRGALLTRSLEKPDRTAHQLRDYDDLLRSRGIEPDLGPPRLPIPPAAAQRAREALERAGISAEKPLALLCLGAAFGWTKRWPPERFGALSGRLAGRGYACAAVIGPGEEDLAAKASAAAKSPLPVLGRDLDPIGLAALLARARLAVANDSGPAHLAAAVGTPVVALFGPTDPGRTSPSGAPVEVLDRFVFCSPCFLKECPYGHECLREITVEMVLAAAERLPGSTDR